MNISTIKVGTPADYAPFSYQNNTSGKYEGFDVELTRC